MAIKERYQSSVLGDSINLDLYAYNNNSLVNLHEIQKIEIYFLDPSQITSTNVEGRRIKEIIYPDTITNEGTGHYRSQLLLDNDLFEIGKYIDIWYVKFNPSDQNYNQITNNFEIHRELIQTNDRPFLYDIHFSFSPKKIVKNSKRYMKIGFYPTVHSDIGVKSLAEDQLNQFYYNIKTCGNIYVRTEMIEGCGYIDSHPDANIITDPEWSLIDIRGDNEGYFMIDSTDEGNYNIGIYNVKFKAEIQGQEIISNKFYLQIYN